MALKDIAIKNSLPKEKQYKLSDEKGLFLLITPQGGKYWRLKYRINGKEKVFALGVYPEISLKEAREKVVEAKQLLKEGIDPSKQRQEIKKKEEIDLANTFEFLAREWHEKQKANWTNKHAGYVLRRLELDIFPKMGNQPIDKITAPELLAILREVENRGAIDITRRLLQTTGQIFRYAIITGKAERDISGDLKGALQTRKKTNYSRLEEKEIPALLAKLRNYDGEVITKLAMEFLLLTFVRTGELRGAIWSEIDFDKKQWHIPAEKMKMRQKHIVPLSSQALNILEKAKEINHDSKYIFSTNRNRNQQMSENTILYALYRMGYHSRTTAHGFRGTASTILNEHGFDSDYIERQLAHGEQNKVRASYNHAQYLKERTEMMQWWGDFLSNMIDR